MAKDRHGQTRNFKPRPGTDSGRGSRPADPGTDYKFNLGADANDRYDVAMFKWTVPNPSLLHDDLRKQERGSDREIDVSHQIAAIKAGYDVALTTTGRKREGRVDTGEELIRATNTSMAGEAFDMLAAAGFVLLDAHYYVRKADPGKKFAKDKFTVVTVFGRDNGELRPAELSAELMSWLWSLAETPFGRLHVWGNPDGTMTWNFGGRQPNLEPHHEVRIEGGRMGLWPCVPEA